MEMDDITKVVGERIRYFRKERGLSQEELAHQASLHNTYIGQLERGEKNATIESLYKVTQALGITLSDFFHTTQTGSKINSYEISQIIYLLENKSEKDQRTLLQILDLLLKWRDGK
ncbi:helix-turn-helix domain-containing protein [Sporosarcina ureae]|nr:helix-turn-helix transcriptional regulator [Sporosarcina ureae]